MEKIKIALRYRRRICLAVFIALAVSLMPHVRLTAKQKKKIHSVPRSHVRRHRRRHKHVHPYLHVSLQPARVREIQEALAKAGFYHDKPDGIWGDTTRDAMKQFQKQHGFAPTGLPEAKPLMLLGLGPHPLPPGLLPLSPAGPAAEAGSAADVETSSTSGSLTQKKPASSN